MSSTILRNVETPPPPSGKPFSTSQLRQFRKRLLSWYDLHRRDLPWRATRDPYRVWLSEIMLQQTRVAAVIGHYHEFLRRFPTIENLAAAREASVLAAWSGLGYYRRARMLHTAAKTVVREYGGKFPADSAALRELPGIGRYTAAAVASIAFGEAVSVVDGNVERVLQRLSLGPISGEELWQAATGLLDPKRPGDFNQAMMELGATVCTPRVPGCVTCPIRQLCSTRGELAALPNVIRQKKLVIHYALSYRKLDYRKRKGGGGEVFLTRRSPDMSLMPCMWELPELRQVKRNQTPVFTLRHSITVTDYTVQVWREATPAASDGGKWIPARSVERLPLTGLALKILRKAEVLGKRNGADHT